MLTTVVSRRAVFASFDSVVVNKMIFYLEQLGLQTILRSDYKCFRSSRFKALDGRAKSTGSNTRRQQVGVLPIFNYFYKLFYRWWNVVHLPFCSDLSRCLCFRSCHRRRCSRRGCCSANRRETLSVFSGFKPILAVKQLS